MVWIFLLQIADPFLLGLVDSSALLLKGRRAILKELLLPAIQDRRLQIQFFAQVRNRHVLQRRRRSIATFSSPV